MISQTVAMDSENTVPSAAEPKDPELPAAGAGKKKAERKKKKRERKKRESVDSKPKDTESASIVKDEHNTQKEEKSAFRKITLSILLLLMFLNHIICNSSVSLTCCKLYQSCKVVASLHLK